MTVLTTSARKRYAVRHPVRIGVPGAATVRGLLIELSAEGCRISGLNDRSFPAGERIAVHLNQVVLTGRVRWAHDGLVGLKLENPLRATQLGELVDLARAQIVPAETTADTAVEPNADSVPRDYRRYGT